MNPRSEHQPQMPVEDFEELDRWAPETVRLEFINGKVIVKPMPDDNHSEIIAWLQRVCMQRLPDQVIAYGREAVQLARATSSGYVARKLQRLRIDLGPLARDARVAELGAEIDALRTL